MQSEEDRQRVTERISVIEGCLAASSQRAEVLAAIADAADDRDAEDAVRRLLGVDRVTAVAVLDMQFRRLTQLNQARLTEELEHLRGLV